VAKRSNKNLEPAAAGAGCAAPRREVRVSRGVKHSWRVGGGGAGRNAVLCHRCGKIRGEQLETPEARAFRQVTGAWPVTLDGGPLFRRHGSSDGAVVLLMAEAPTYSTGELLWCANWETGATLDVPVDALVAVPAAEQPAFDQAYARIASWAEAGSSDAMWWLGQWHEGSEHARSIWYYIAAHRRDPAEHGWALRRNTANARFGLMCPGKPLPSLDFLRDIAEFRVGEVSTDWKAAERAAREAVDVPVAGAQVEAMFSLMREGVDVDQAGWQAGVPTCNLHAHPQWQAFEADRVKAEAAQEAESRARWERHAVVAREALEAPAGTKCPYPEGSADAYSWNIGRGFDDDDPAF
jgi:hypothetical protein